MERDVLQSMLALGFFGILGTVIVAVAAIIAIYNLKR